MSVGEITHIGRPTNRVDGKLKVTGQAHYAAEYPADDLLYGYIVGSTTAAGRIAAMDLDAARQFPGVVEIFTHENRSKAAWLDRSWRDEVAPPGHPFRPLHSDRILFDGQPVALIVAETFEAARDAGSLIRIAYDVDAHCTELEAKRAEAYVPPEQRSGIPPPPDPRGDAEQAFQDAPVKISRDYRVNAEHHNPMELFASTVVWEDGARLTVYDKTQGVQLSLIHISEPTRPY